MAHIRARYIRERGEAGITYGGDEGTEEMTTAFLMVNSKSRAIQVKSFHGYSSIRVSSGESVKALLTESTL